MENTTDTPKKVHILDKNSGFLGRVGEVIAEDAHFVIVKIEVGVEDAVKTIEHLFHKNEVTPVVAETTNTEVEVPVVDNK